MSDTSALVDPFVTRSCTGPLLLVGPIKEQIDAMPADVVNIVTPRRGLPPGLSSRAEFPDEPDMYSFAIRCLPEAVMPRVRGVRWSTEIIAAGILPSLDASTPPESPEPTP